MRLFSIFVFFVFALGGHLVGEEASATRPNFLLIMADDLGWGDVGFNGNTTVQTPNLDQMAEAGLQMNRFYAAASLCSPTRASVLTGRHSWRYGVYRPNLGRLPTEELTLYEVLKAAGYRTGHFGKWHLGTLTTTTRDSVRGKLANLDDYSAPWHLGVDACLVTEAKVPTYDPMFIPDGVDPNTGWDAADSDETLQFYGTRYWIGEGQAVPIDSPQLRGDDSKVITDAAVPFIEASVAEGKPFLAVVWFHAPHFPVSASAEHRALYPGTSTYESNYYGSITALDEQVGRLRAKLRELGVAENTMVAFCSDNGPQGPFGKVPSSPGTTGGFRGRKATLYEGGIRVPGLLEWPGVVKPGMTDAAVTTSDYFPTLLAAAGLSFEKAAPHPLDGLDLAPLWEGKWTERPAPIAFQDYRGGVLSDTQYKALLDKATGTWELYDLIEDPFETTDLGGKYPEVLQSMRAQWEAWKEACAMSDAGGDYAVSDR